MTFCLSLSSLGVLRQVSGDREVKLSKVMDDYQPSAFPSSVLRDLQSCWLSSMKTNLFLHFYPSLYLSHTLSIFLLSSIYSSNSIILNHFIHFWHIWRTPSIYAADRLPPLGSSEDGFFSGADVNRRGAWQPFCLPTGRWAERVHV